MLLILLPACLQSPSFSKVDYVGGARANLDGWVLKAKINGGVNIITLSSTQLTLGLPEGSVWIDVGLRVEKL